MKKSAEHIIYTIGHSTHSWEDFLSMLKSFDIRSKGDQALFGKNTQAMKAQWKQAQVQSSISKALEGLTFENQYEGSFASAKEKIQEKQAEAAARQEMMAGSLHGKLACSL